MKRKKLLSLTLAGALSLSLCVPALADGPEAPPTAEDWNEPSVPSPELLEGEDPAAPAEWFALEEPTAPMEWAGTEEPTAPTEWAGTEEPTAPTEWAGTEEPTAPTEWAGTEEPTVPIEWAGTEEPVPSPEEAGSGEAVPEVPSQPAEPWYAEAQRYVMEQGIMSGSGGNFDPDGIVTRVVAFHALWNMEGMPPEKDVAPFSDVALDAWYQDSASWAREAGITQGDGAGRYNPQWTISRSELACAFYRYAQFKGLDVTVADHTAYLNYSDALSVPDYASDAFRWAVDRGIINGKVQDWVLCLDFGGSATRAELAAMLMRLNRLLTGESSAQTPGSQSAS